MVAAQQLPAALEWHQRRVHAMRGVVWRGVRRPHRGCVGLVLLSCFPHECAISRLAVTGPGDATPHISRSCSRDTYVCCRCSLKNQWGGWVHPSLSSPNTTTAAFQAACELSPARLWGRKPDAWMMDGVHG